MWSGSTLISLVAVWGVDWRHEAVSTGRRWVAQERGFWWLRPGRWQRRWKGLDDFEWYLGGKIESTEYWLAFGGYEKGKSAGGSRDCMGKWFLDSVSHQSHHNFTGRRASLGWIEGICSVNLPSTPVPSSFELLIQSYGFWLDSPSENPASLAIACYASVWLHAWYRCWPSDQVLDNKIPFWGKGRTRGIVFGVLAQEGWHAIDVSNHVSFPWFKLVGSRGGECVRWRGTEIRNGETFSCLNSWIQAHLRPALSKRLLVAWANTFLYSLKPLEVGLWYLHLDPG